MSYVPAGRDRVTRTTAHPAGAGSPAPASPRRGSSARELATIVALFAFTGAVLGLWVVPAFLDMGEAIPDRSFVAHCGEIVELPSGLTAVIVCEDEGPRSEVAP